MTAREEINRIYENLSVSGKAEFICLLLCLCEKSPKGRKELPASHPPKESQRDDS